MSLLVPGLLGDDSDKAWEWFGRQDPYYGVLSGGEYHLENLSDDQLRFFFETGAMHVERVFRVLSKHFEDMRTGKCLDFGSGVGRLVIPFAQRFEVVTGVDISPSMISEAQKNCEQYGIRNANFFHSLNEVEGSFDLVHSYIVLQHIPISRGEKLIEQLIEKTAPSGVCFLHFTIGRNLGHWRKAITSCRKNIKPLHCALNFIEGKRFDEAYMQSNEYNLNRIVSNLFKKNIKHIWLESENHGGPYSVCLAFRVP